MNRDVQRVQPGTNVYSIDNDKVGDVAEVGGNYLLVRKGFLFTTDRYIPFSAISRIDTDGVYLNVAKEQFDSMAWDQPPVEDTTTYTGSTSAAPIADASYAQTSRADHTTANIAGSNEAKIPIIEEELRVGKREVETGGVRVNTRVEEVPVNEQVTVRDETIDVHRRRQERPVTEEDLAILQQGSFEVRERDEEVIVDKQARVVEELHVKKNVEERTETVQDTVRRTDVDVQEVGGRTSTTAQAGAQEGMIERGLGNANNTIERTTGLDTDQSGAVGDRDPRNNY